MVTMAKYLQNEATYRALVGSNFLEGRGSKFFDPRRGKFHHDLIVFQPGIMVIIYGIYMGYIWDMNHPHVRPNISG